MLSKKVELPKNPYCEYMKAVQAKYEQLELDFQKWLESEANKQDMSGKMLYCTYCKHSNGISKCDATQEQRIKECCCAAAYKRLLVERNI